MFKFFKKNKVESLGEVNKTEIDNKIDLFQVIEELKALSVDNGVQTTLVIVDANGLKIMLIKIVMTLGVDLGLKEAKQVVDNSGSFASKLSAEQATDLIAACKTHGIILEIA